MRVACGSVWLVVACLGVARKVCACRVVVVTVLVVAERVSMSRRLILVLLLRLTLLTVEEID